MRSQVLSSVPSKKLYCIYMHPSADSWIRTRINMVIYHREGLVKCKRTPPADKKYARNGSRGIWCTTGHIPELLGTVHGTLALWEHWQPIVITSERRGLNQTTTGWGSWPNPGQCSISAVGLLQCQSEEKGAESLVHHPIQTSIGHLGRDLGRDAALRGVTGEIFL